MVQHTIALDEYHKTPNLVVKMHPGSLQILHTIGSICSRMKDKRGVTPQT